MQPDEADKLIVPGLPFQTETNTGFGILFKTYLDVLVFSFEGDAITESNVDSQGVKDAKSQALDFVEQSFESVKNPRLEVERGFRFWDTVSLPPSKSLLVDVLDIQLIEH